MYTWPCLPGYVCAKDLNLGPHGCSASVSLCPLSHLPSLWSTNMFACLLVYETVLQWPWSAWCLLYRTFLPHPSKCVITDMIYQEIFTESLLCAVDMGNMKVNKLDRIPILWKVGDNVSKGQGTRNSEETSHMHMSSTSTYTCMCTYTHLHPQTNTHGDTN